jgi:hypothetical protein
MVQQAEIVVQTYSHVLCIYTLILKKLMIYPTSYDFGLVKLENVAGRWIYYFVSDR